MFLLLLKKEMKIFFTNKGNLIFMIALPIIFVFLLSVCLESYMDANYDTFAEGRVYYYKDNPSAETLNTFYQLSAEIEQATGVTTLEVDNYEEAQALVEASEGYGVISLLENGMNYYRSPYNESNGGKIIRSLYEQLTKETAILETEYVKTITLKTNPINSKVYYTFSGLAFVILYMAFLIANVTYDERGLRTIDRIRISKAGVGNMFVCKIVTGILCGIVMIITVLLFSNIVLGVTWGKKLPLMFLVLLFLVLFSSVFGAVLGMVSKNKSMCQSIVLVVNILCGYLGGAFLPLTILENMSVLKLFVRVSPLYWTNRALASLYNGVVDTNTYNSIGVLAGLSAVLILLYFAGEMRGRRRKYEKCD